MNQEPIQPIYKGIVKENVVVLEAGTQLPDGTRVEVRLTQQPQKRSEAFARVLNNRITRYVGIDEIIEADKKERERHSDTWFKP